MVEEKKRLKPVLLNHVRMPWPQTEHETLVTRPHGPQTALRLHKSKVRNTEKASCSLCLPSNMALLVSRRWSSGFDFTGVFVRAWERRGGDTQDALETTVNGPVSTRRGGWIAEERWVWVAEAGGGEGQGGGGKHRSRGVILG